MHKRNTQIRLVVSRMLHNAEELLLTKEDVKKAMANNL